MFAPKGAKPQKKASEGLTNSLAPQHSAFAGHRLDHNPVEQALFLQRKIGNQATLRLLAQQASRSEQQAAATPLPGAIKAKLVVGQVNDPLEQEADQVANQVMRMPDRKLSIGAIPLQVSRKCAAGEAPDVVHEALRLPGQPLDASTRAFFEPRFGRDFSPVRVHVGDLASRSANVVRAFAYTVGNDIVFGAGKYSPDTGAGKRLLAHELGHVVQQASAATRVQRDADTGDSVPATGGGQTPQAAPPAAEPPVFFCGKSVAAGLFKHAFFRVGGAGPSNPTFELEHDELGDHCTCGFQGHPTSDYPEDRDATDAPCVPLPGVTQSCLAANFMSYPIGRYCATGPNSNTYARWLAETCGAVGAKPPGGRFSFPGFDDNPPKPGTAAPPSFPGTGVLGTVGLCGEIDCDNDFCVVSD